MKQQLTDGEVAYIVWAGQSEQLDIPFATDTLVVLDGKIVLQTFVAQMEAKPDEAEIDRIEKRSKQEKT